MKQDPSPIKIVVVGMGWPPETFLAQLARGLAEAGVQVTIASGVRPGAAWRSLANLRWLHAPSWDRSAYPARLLRLAGMFASGLLRSPADLRAFAAHARRAGGPLKQLRAWYGLLPFAGRRWDVIYFPWNSIAIAYLPLFDLGPPVLLSCRGAQVNVAPYDPQRHDLRAGLHATFEKAAAVHCVSQDIQREAMQFGLSPEKAHVIRPAVDPDFFHPPAAPRPQDGAYRVVTTGALIWRKGYEYALLAVRALKEMGAPLRFEIVGDGPERARLVYTIQDLGLEGDVKLLGQLPPEGVRQRLQRADVFLLASLSEGISNAALEAMACGLPLVTTDCGGMREAVADGVQGFITPLRAPEAMAQALWRLWEAPELRARMGAAARARIEREFTLERQVRQFIGVCQNLAAGSRNGRGKNHA